MGLVTNSIESLDSPCYSKIISHSVSQSVNCVFKLKI